MMTTVEGVYKDGRVTLKETLSDVTEGRVLVTFLQTDNRLPPAPTDHIVQFGTFPELQTVTDEDFQAAEFHPAPDHGLDWS